MRWANLLFWLIPERRKVTRINLQKCFPHKSADEREALARAHFRAFTPRLHRAGHPVVVAARAHSCAGASSKAWNT